MIYTLTLSPAIDYNMYINKVNIDEINKSKSESFHAGGKGINVSLVLKELGQNSTCLGFLGGFTGEFIGNYLDEQGIKNDFVWTDYNTRINVKISADSGETAIDGTGPYIGEVFVERLIKKIKKLKKGDWLVLSGNTCAGVDNTIYERILNVLNKDVLVFVDTVRELFLSTLKYHPIYVKPNISELEEVLKIKINNDYDLRKASEKLQELGARNVVVSLGEKGCYLLNEDQNETFVEVPSELLEANKVINTIGCGDSVVAGIIYKSIKEANIVESVKYGVACGSASAYSEHFGSKQQIEDIYKLIK